MYSFLFWYNWNSSVLLSNLIESFGQHKNKIRFERTGCFFRWNLEFKQFLNTTSPSVAKAHQFQIKCINRVFINTADEWLINFALNWLRISNFEASFVWMNRLSRSLQLRRLIFPQDPPTRLTSISTSLASLLWGHLFCTSKVLILYRK